MARKAIKQEHLSAMHEAHSDLPDPRSSGDTIVIDSDSTMTDEGYQTNHQAKKSSRFSRPQYEEPSNKLIMFRLRLWYNQ